MSFKNIPETSAVRPSHRANLPVHTDGGMALAHRHPRDTVRRQLSRSLLHFVPQAHRRLRIFAKIPHDDTSRCFQPVIVSNTHITTSPDLKVGVQVDSNQSGAVGCAYIHDGDIFHQHAALLLRIPPRVERWVAVNNAPRASGRRSPHIRMMSWRWR
jgi:hypothetical protein